MRAARAASMRNKAVVLAASSGCYVDSRTPTPTGHKPTSMLLTGRREATFSASAIKAKRTPRYLTKKNTRAGAKVALQNDAASRFPRPYPGVDPGRPPRATSPIASMRQRHRAEINSPGQTKARRRAEHHKVFTGENLEAVGDKRRKRPRSANDKLSRVVSDRSITPLPTLSGQNMRQCSQPVKGCKHSRLALGDRWYAERRESPAKEHIFRDSGSKKVKRPASAPPRHELETSQNGGVLEALSRLRAASHNAPEELRVMKWVLLRETYIAKLHEVVSAERKRTKFSKNGRVERSADSTGRQELFGLLTELLILLRRITVEIVEAVERWRWRRNDKPFFWGSSNYLLKAASDLSFLARLPGLEKHLGVSISNNPFLSHVDIDGRSAQLPTRRTKGADRRPEVGIKSTEFPSSGSKSLGVSAKRVEAAAAVVYREVLQAQGMQNTTRSNSPTRLMQLRRRTQACPPTSLWGGKGPRHAYESFPVLPLDAMIDEPVTLYTGDEIIDYQYERHPEEKFRKIYNHDQGYPFADYPKVCYRGKDSLDGERPSQHDGQGMVEHSSIQDGRENNATRGDYDLPEYHYVNVSYQRHLGHVDERRRYNKAVSKPVPLLRSFGDPGYLGRVEQTEQREVEGDRQSSEPTSAQRTTERSDVTESPDIIETDTPDVLEARDSLNPQIEMCGTEEIRQSPFMAVFKMCDGMLTNLHKFEASMDDALVVNEASSFAATPSNGKEMTQGHVVRESSSPWESEHRKWDMVNKDGTPGESLIPSVSVERQREKSDKSDAPVGEQLSSKTQSFGAVDKESLPRCVACECQGQNVYSAPRMDRDMQKDEDKSEEDCLDWLKRETPQNTLVNIFRKWAIKTEAWIAYRKVKAEKYQRRGMLRRAITLWKAYRAQLLRIQLAEEFTGVFDRSKVFVHHAFNALRVHAKGTRVAKEKRSAMETLAARLEYMGKMLLTSALRRWLRSATQSRLGNDQELTRLGEPRVEGWMAESFDKLQPPVDVWQTRRTKSQLAASLAVSLVAMVGVTSETAVAAAVTKCGQGSHLVARNIQEDSWERWLEVEGSVVDPHLGEQEVRRQQGQREDGKAVHSATDAGRRGISDIESPKSPKDKLRRLEANIKAIRSSHDIRENAQAQSPHDRSSLSFADAPMSQSTHQSSLVANSAMGVVNEQREGKSVVNVPCLHQADVLQLNTAAHRIQCNWRGTQERRVAARVSKSVLLF